MSKAVHHGTGLERIELERMEARLGRLFAALRETAEMVVPHEPGAWVPAVDLCESDDAVAVYVEVPGVRAEHLDVTLSGTELRVSGRKEKNAPRGVISHLCTERGYGRFMRVVSLRWPVRAGGARAALRDGVLTIHLPKLKERRGGEFKITVTESGE